MIRFIANHFAPAALAVLSLNLVGPFSGVDAAASLDAKVKCLQESPEVCIGVTYQTGPSPAYICDDMANQENCRTEFVGGYSWTWDFVQGLEEGESDMDKIDYAKTSARIKVEIEDGDCKITVGEEQCTKCSVSDCESDLKTISYDCTNLENGKSSGDQCEVFADPFFFPFKIAATIAPTKALRGTIPNDEEEATISETITETSSGTISTNAALLDPEVKCLQESPEVCIGITYQTGPSPKVICDPADSNSCRTEFVGGYSWTWDFVQGLEEGESDMDKIDYAKTSARIKVEIEDGDCKITVGEEQCTKCSVSDCESDLKTISYDCTNLENGKSSGDQCESFRNPFFYPFISNVPATIAPTSNAISKNIPNDEEEGTISETVSEPSFCPNDIKLLSTVGATKYQDGSANPDIRPAVKIVSQDTSTISVNLTQAWASSTINNYFYEYKKDTFDTKCYEKVDLQGQGKFIDAITIQCEETVAYASLRICLQDATGELLGPNDNATVPKCCHSGSPKETPTVCYNLEISCVPQCGGSTKTLDRRGLGSDSGKENDSLSIFDLPPANVEVSKIPYAASIELNAPNGIHGDVLTAPGFMASHGGWSSVLLTGAALTMTVL